MPVLKMLASMIMPNRENAVTGSLSDWGHCLQVMMLRRRRFETLQKMDSDALIDAIVRQPGAGHADDIENRINDFWYILVQE